MGGDKWSSLRALWVPSSAQKRVVVRSMVVGAIILMAGVGWLAQQGASGSRLKASNFSAIRPGMTRHQVQDLLGGPPGDYGHYADGIIQSGDGSVSQVFYVPTTSPVKPVTWQDDRNQFFLFFDDQGQVVAASKANDFRRYNPNSVLSRLKRIVSGLF